jgi:hypothetical protein
MDIKQHRTTETNLRGYATDVVYGRLRLCLTP